MNRRFVLGVRYDDLDSRASLRCIEEYVSNRRLLDTRLVYFTNVHTVHTALRNRSLTRAVHDADLVLPDGMGLILHGQLTGSPVRENLNGTDFTPRVLAMARDRRWSVFLLGGSPSVVKNAVDALRRMFPGLRIAGSHDGYFRQDESDDIVEEVNAHSPDILLVAMGTPRQELWLRRNRNRINAGVCLAVGGLFDFLSGKRSRAPRWLRSVGLEWLYRFFLEPAAKAKRVFIEIPVFLARISLNRFHRMGEPRHKTLAG